jgi:hypothetical protein
MKNIYTRLLNGGNAKELEDMQEAFAGRNAEIGPVYPESRIIVAEDGTKPVLFMPVQSCYFMGSLGYKEVNRLQLASAMRQITATLVWESRAAGRGEIFFIGGNEESDNFAAANDYELVKEPVYRLRIRREDGQ